MRRRVAIIGGGASGLVASLVSAKGELDVSLFEKSSKVGRKILATGNGRCNISNKNVSVSNYHGKNPSFVKYALNQLNVEKFFSNLGLEFIVGKNSKLFPMSLQSSSVVDILYYHVKKSAVKVHLSYEVKNIEKKGEKFLVDGAEFDIVVIASGSEAMPTLGSSDSGYKFARKFNHKIEKPFASLVQLVSNDEKVKSASGVKIDADLEIYVDKVAKMSVRGDLLFTNYGLSGSAILDISRVASGALSRKKDVEIKIDLMPQISQDGLKSLLLKRAKLNLPVELWLNGIIHKKLIPLLDINANEINRKAIHKLAYDIKNLSVKIDDTKGVKSCEVMAGGVSTADINPKTFESKLVKNLFFCGEVLDIDGDCGGFNLHFAWVSGYVVGNTLCNL